MSSADAVHRKRIQVFKMIGNISKIHVFSYIPNLSSLVMKELPKTAVINVVNKNNEPLTTAWLNSVVTNEEFSEIKNAEIIFGDAHLVAQVYENLSNAKFVQCTYAGAEVFIDKVKKLGVMPQFPVARLGVQILGQYLAEYIIGQILIQERNWIDVHHNQLKNIWSQKDNISVYKSLQLLTIGVLGVGNMGSEVIRALKYFRCTVLGLGRSQERPEDVPVDEYYSTSDLPSFLENCDYIVNVLPFTPDTVGFLGNDVLRFARKKPVLINSGRGNVISEKDICKALDNTWISRAILDVFEAEPLPTSSKLWNHPKVTVTPHVAGTNKAEDKIPCLIENLKRYSEGRPLLHLVNWEAGY